MNLSDVSVLGITGGIGTGKSTAAEYIASKGFVHIDADAIGRNITAANSPLIEVLERTFSGQGEKAIVLPDGNLDRKALASIVFNDPDKKRLLDEIMFEKIEKIIRDDISKADDPVLLDAPLLFESGIDHLCDKVILLVCDLEKRLERVRARDGAEREDILARIKNQMSDDEKIARADYVIDNSGDVEDLYLNIDEVMSAL